MLFTTIAAFSFAAFRETEQVCAQASNCTRLTPPKNNGEMLWDLISRQFISLVSI